MPVMMRYELRDGAFVHDFCVLIEYEGQKYKKKRLSVQTALKRRSLFQVIRQKETASTFLL